MNERIEINPRVCGGQPVVRGTRIPVNVILGQIAEGESWEALLAGYPELKREDIQAALRFKEQNVLNADNPDHGIAELLLTGRAATAAEAEESFLNEHLADVLRLAASPLSNGEFRNHPLIRLLLARGSRAREDSLA